MPISPGTPARSSVHTPASLIMVLALLTALAPLAIDMYLPAFPAMAVDLNTSAAAVQLTMTAFLAGLAVGQLVVGPWSDGIGRRLPLLIGSFACLVASVLCAWAPTVEWLTGARFAQGLTGAAGVVLARAIVSDTARGAAAAKLLGVLMIISVIAPVVGPLAGGGIIAGFGWRAVFWVQAALVLVMFVGALVFVRESLPAAERSGGGLRATMTAAGAVLSRRNYTGYLLTFCFAFAGLFAYISASPFVIQNILGFSEMGFTLLFALNAVAITAVSAVAAALAGRVPYRRMTGLGLIIAFVAAAGLLACALTTVPVLPTLILFGVFQGSLGLIFGNATALALREAGHHAGMGSAFLGFLQFALAAAVAPLVGILGEHSALPMGVAMVVSIALAAGAFLVIARGGHPADTDAPGDVTASADMPGSVTAS